MPKTRQPRPGREWHRLYSEIYRRLLEDHAPGLQRTWADTIRLLRRCKVHPEALIANACWYVFLDAPDTFAGFSAEKIAECVGHDWHSLKNLARPAHRTSASVAKSTSRIAPDRLLSPDLLTEAVRTPEEKLALVAKTVPRIPRFMEGQRAAALAEERVVMDSLRRLRLSYGQIARLLDTAASALGIKDKHGNPREYKPQALLMRSRRSSS